MSKKDKVIKVTKDGKFHAMGLVVDTWDEAVERCERKGTTSNIFLCFPETYPINDLEAEFEVCGSPDYLKQFLQLSL